MNGGTRRLNYIFAGRMRAALSQLSAALRCGSPEMPKGDQDMNIPSKLLCAAALAGLAFTAASPAQALTSQECSAKYQAAKKDGTLGTQKWNDFRKAQCGDGATPAPTAAAPAAAPAAPKEAAKDTKKDTKKEAAAPAAPAGPAVFPNAVDPKYSKESEGKARMHTCVDQYNANKASNANGGLKWIQKGGGYYSECSKKLKGAA
jgi:hypothetical protein